jgi:7-cyano-7-deazaguanine reductase
LERHEQQAPLFGKIADMPTKPSKKLETFPNPNPDRDFAIRMRMPEFTCVCPMTGQPDFATLYLEYVADKSCVELKSLKLYIWSFRDEGVFHEAVTNRILDDLVAATRPRFMRLTAVWNVRGGIYTHVVAEHRGRGWGASKQLPPAAWHVDPTGAGHTPG